MAPTNSAQRGLQDIAHRIATTALRPQATQIDRERLFPSQSLTALADAGLWGILVPTGYGGRGGTLTELATVCEQAGWGCASTAMCFLMHSCGCAVIASKATPEQGERWLRPAARGEALATLAFSERASGAHFYSPEITVQRRDGALHLTGRKSFVTNGGHARLYPVLVKSEGTQGLDMMILTPDLPGLSFEGQWDGVGMAGNSSITMVLCDSRVPEENRLGREGECQEMVFGVVAPTFLIGLAAVNVGIAQAALDGAVEHAQSRRYPTGEAMAEVQIIQTYLAEMSAATQAARQLAMEAARAADAQEDSALTLIMQAKLVATEASRMVTEKAMQVGGGQAYGRQLPLERYWRDARAGSVMAPTNEVLKVWLGKTLAGLPIF